MFSTPDFWVLISFIFFLGLFGKRGLAFLLKTLDQHRQKVTQQLDEAQRLHDEAFSLLNSYKKKHEDALVQAKHIIDAAEKDAFAFKKSSEQEFEKFLIHKEKAFLERMAIEAEETKAKLRSQAADEALALVKDVLSKSPQERKELTKTSLKEIANLRLKG